MFKIHKINSKSRNSMCGLLLFEKRSKNSKQTANWPETRLFPVDPTMANMGNGTELQFSNEASLWNDVCLQHFEREKKKAVKKKNWV